MLPPAALTWWNVAQNGDVELIAVNSQMLMPLYGLGKVTARCLAVRFRNLPV